MESFWCTFCRFVCGDSVLWFGEFPQPAADAAHDNLSLITVESINKSFALKIIVTEYQQSGSKVQATQRRTRSPEDVRSECRKLPGYSVKLQTHTYINSTAA